MNKNLVGIMILLIKIGGKFVKPLLSGGKLLKVGLFGGSAAAYSAIFGWKVAVMILVLLFLHEGGHLVAMKMRGMKTKGMYFIPFLGAAAVSEEEFPSREAEGFVALMGPTVGLALCLFSYLLYEMTGDLEFAAAAGWMALINLLNLLPIMPFDGGRVLRSISFSFNSGSGIYFTFLGMIIGTIVLIKMGVYLFVILIPIGILEVLFDHKEEKRKAEFIKVKEVYKDGLFKDINELESQKSGLSKDEAIMRLRKAIENIDDRLKKDYILMPKMSSQHITRYIVWTLLLTAALFLTTYWSGAVTNWDYIEILR